MDKIISDYDDIVNDMENVSSSGPRGEQDGHPHRPPTTITTTTTTNTSMEANHNIPTHTLRTESMCTSVMNVLLGLAGGNPNMLDNVDDDEEEYYEDLQLQVDLANITSKYITKGIPFGWNNKSLLLEEIGLFFEPLALQHKPLLCLAILMRLTNLQNRSQSSLTEIFTKAELQRIYQAVTQVLQQPDASTKETRAHLCLQRMSYFVLKEYLLDAIIAVDDTTKRDLTIFSNNKDTSNNSKPVIPQALRLLPKLSETEKDPTKVKAALDSLAQRMLPPQCNSSKALSALYAVSLQLVEKHLISLSSNTTSDANGSSFPLTVLLYSTLSKAASDENVATNESLNASTRSGLTYYHALQLRLWLDYGPLSSNNAPLSVDDAATRMTQPTNDYDYLELLRIFVSTCESSRMPPLSCILWIRYIERELKRERQPGSFEIVKDEYESFLASQLKHFSDMVVLEAARVIIESPQSSTKVLEAAASVLQVFTPPEKLKQRKIKPLVRRQAARLLERVGVRFLGQLGISA